LFFSSYHASKIKGYFFGNIAKDMVTLPQTPVRVDGSAHASPKHQLELMGLAMPLLNTS
jgi:hypothetical protein